MANQYDVWMPTEPIRLPVDTFQQAGLMADAQVESDIASLGNVISTYQNITPASANPKALYDQTMDEIKSRVGALGGMNLKSPEAKRKIASILGDRTIVNNLKGIMQDKLYYDQKKKDYDEYIKKNPGVNAWTYEKAFNDMGQEKGNANEFDPNRFARLGVLKDFVDVQKELEDRVQKIQGDEIWTKNIVGDLYHEYKRSGRLTDAIRQYAFNTMMTDPRYKEQLAQTLQYQYYLSDNVNPVLGKAKMAASIRQNVADQIMQLQNSLVDLKTKISKEKNQIKAAELQQVYNAKRYSLRNLEGSYQPGSDMWNNDDALTSNNLRLGIVQGLEAFATNNIKDFWTYTPMAMARFHESNAWARFKAKMESEKQKPEIDPTTIRVTPTVADQQNPDDAKSRKGIAAELGITIDDNGTFSKNNYKSDPPAPTSYDESIQQRAQRMLTSSSDKKKQDKEFANKQYEKEKETIKRLYKSAQLDDFEENSFSTDADYQRAANQIINWKQKTQKIFNFSANIPGWSQDEKSIKEVAGNIAGGSAALYDDKGKSITDPAERYKIAQAMVKDQFPINADAYNSSIDGAAISFSYGGRTYFTTPTMDVAQATAGFTKIVKELKQGNFGAKLADGNIFVSGFVKDKSGNADVKGIAFIGAGDKTYQENASALYNQTLTKLVGETGKPKEVIQKELNKQYFDISENRAKALTAALQTGDQKLIQNAVKAPAYITIDGKQYSIVAPVMKKGDYYLTDAQVSPTAGGSKDFSQYSREQTAQLYGPNGPYRDAYLRLYDAKTRTASYESGVDASYPSIPSYNVDDF